MEARRSFELTLGDLHLAVLGLVDGDRAMYVIRQRRPAVRAAPGDATYPLPALGFLELDDNVVTGMLERAFLDRDSARALVAAVAERHVGGVQTIETLDLVRADLRLVESGEESLRFAVEGDEDVGFRTAATPADRQHRRDAEAPAAPATRFVPGQPLWTVQYGRLYERPGGAEFGPILVVGTQLAFVGEDARGYYQVRDPQGRTGWVLPSRVSERDERVSFTIRGRSVAGYLVSGMYDDFSGGSLSHFALEEASGLGVVHVETARIAAIELQAQPGAVALTLDDGARLYGKGVRAWLVCPAMRLALGGATGSLLERG